MGKGRSPCCDKSKVKRGPWSSSEDLQLITFIQQHGHSNWRALPSQAGLLRCGKSCRLRWINYLRPDVKRGNFTPEEEQSIIKLHEAYGNKWSKIASHLPGRSDNEIKNVWNTHLKKRLGIKSSKSNTSKRMKFKKLNPDDSVVESSSLKSSSSLLYNHQVDRDSKSTTSHTECEMPYLQRCQASPSDDGHKESSSPSLTSRDSNISTKDRNLVQMDTSLDMPLEGMDIDDLGALDELGFETLFELEEKSFWNNLEFNNLCSVHTNETEDRPSKASEESSSIGFEEMHAISSEVITQNWIRNLEIELGLDDI